MGIDFSGGSMSTDRASRSWLMPTYTPARCLSVTSLSAVPE
jgi:hypothetical protein